MKGAEKGGWQNTKNHQLCYSATARGLSLPLSSYGALRKSLDLSGPLVWKVVSKQLFLTSSCDLYEETNQGAL